MKDSLNEHQTQEKLYSSFGTFEVTLLLKCNFDGQKGHTHSADRASDPQAPFPRDPPLGMSVHAWHEIDVVNRKAAAKRFF